MTAPIILHVETSDRHFAGYLEQEGRIVPLTEEDFQILIETLAGTAATAEHILQNFMATSATEIEVAE